MELKYIELLCSNGDIFKILSDNILEWNIEIIRDYVDCSLFSDSGTELLDLVDTFLLVIKNYHNIENISPNGNTKKFNPELKNICYIRLTDIENNIISCYVDMSHDEFNENQINSLKDDNLYISIEDNKNIL